MANLNYTTKELIEELFDMGSGYVLDFSNSSFERFVKDVIGIDIYYGEGYKEYCSKANKLRQIFENEPDGKVIKIIEALLKRCENYKLKNNELTDYDKKIIGDIKRDIEDIKNKNKGKVIIDEEVDELIQKISTRNAQLSEMAIDEKLKELGNLIEYLLKDKKKFIELDYQDISCGFINEDDVKKLRKKVQCFRHSSKDSINERNTYTKNQKIFMIEYGAVICNLIYRDLKNTNLINPKSV